ncbi:hypothetical protein M0811_07678 [Anaeramoeba ignava]|uniref:Uncharacterized protein n=1 Tax=Anaeramoeba ignava TaxID=1746090 RepID=A0A9Q0LM82_ANAIG|nr:hypothetical protein M0811_07678 [Anaeramoeba ignava]
MKKPRNLLKPIQKAILAAEKDIGAEFFDLKLKDLIFLKIIIEKEKQINKYSKNCKLKKLFNNKIQDFNSKINKSIIWKRHENARSRNLKGKRDDLMRK